MLYQMKVSQNSITFTWSASKGHPRLTAKVPVERIMTWSFWWLAIIRIPPNQHNQSSTIIKIQQNSFCCFWGFQRIDFRRYWSGGRMIPNRVGDKKSVCLIFGLIGKGQGRVGKHCRSLWTKKFSNISNGPSCVHPIFLFWSNELWQILFLPIFVSLGAQNIADFPLFFGQSTKYRRFLTHSEEEQSTSFSRHTLKVLVQYKFPSSMKWYDCQLSMLQLQRCKLS